MERGFRAGPRRGVGGGTPAATPAGGGRSGSEPITHDQAAQNVPVTSRLVFRAVAEKGHRTHSCQLPYEAERELLTMVLDDRAAGVYPSAHEELGPVFPSELGPRHPARPKGLHETLAGPERCHPHMVAALWQATTSKSRREYAKAIAFFVDGARYRLAPEHVMFPFA